MLKKKQTKNMQIWYGTPQREKTILLNHCACCQTYLVVDQVLQCLKLRYTENCSIVEYIIKFQMDLSNTNIYPHRERLG